MNKPQYSALLGIVLCVINTAGGFSMEPFRQLLPCLDLIRDGGCDPLKGLGNGNFTCMREGKSECGGVLYFKHSSTCWPEESGARWPEELGARWPEESGARWSEELGARWPEESGARWPKESDARWSEESGARWPEESGARWPEESGARSLPRLPVAAFRCFGGQWKRVAEGTGHRMKRQLVINGDGVFIGPGVALCNVYINGVLYNHNCDVHEPPPSCSASPNIEHGSKSCTDSNQAGSVCTYFCNTGYMMTGSPTVECLQSGKWNQHFPKCHAISCGDPGSVSGGQFTCSQGHVYPHACAIECHPGYQHTGATSIQCSASGQWTQSDQCFDVEGPTFPNGCPANQSLFSGPQEAAINVTWDDPLVIDNSGQNVTLTYSLLPGTVLGPGSYIVKATAEDYVGNSNSCNFSIVIEARRCETLPPVANGHVICTKTNVEGSECTVTCNHGYQLQGQTTLTCQESETWDVGTPSCADTEIPEFPNGCPHDQHVFAARAGEETTVSWSEPEVTDSSGEAVLLYSDVTSGSTFPLGYTHVTYTATDSSSNTNNCSFGVTVTELYCEDPISELTGPHGEYPLSNCSHGHVYGSECTLGCTHGYRLVGEGRVACERFDDTHPPTMKWTWFGPQSSKPSCKEDNCPPLTPPKNGALSCYLGDLGWDCLMSCDASWDIQFQDPTFQGHFYCTNQHRAWIPAEVPDCVVRYRPREMRMKSHLFYLTGSCDVVVNELRQNFVTRIESSRIFKDACINVPQCTAENVEVACAPLTSFRAKRDVSKKATSKDHIIAGLRMTGNNRRDNASHYVLLTFDVNIPYDETGATPEDTYVRYMSTVGRLTDTLKAHAQSGRLKLSDRLSDGCRVGSGVVMADCPPGTVFKSDHHLSRRFSCVGCSKGYFMSVNSTVCEACPVGTYSEIDSATSCTPCPFELATPTTASYDKTHCTLNI